MKGFLLIVLPSACKSRPQISHFSNCVGVGMNGKKLRNAVLPENGFGVSRSGKGTARTVLE